MRLPRHAACLAAAIILFLPCPAARATDDKTQFTNGLSGSMNVTSPTLGIMDKSYPLSSLGAFRDLVAEFRGNPGQTTVKDARSYAEDLQKIGRPEEMLWIGGQARAGKGPSLYAAPEVLYSRMSWGMDLGYQHYEGAIQGNGVGLRINPTPEQREMASRLAQLAAQRDGFYNTVNRLAALLSSKGGSFDQPLEDIARVNDGDAPALARSTIQAMQATVSAYDRAADAYYRAAFHLTAAFLAGYRDLDAGTVRNVGITLAKLINWEPRPSAAGVLFQASLEDLQITDKASASRSVGRWGLSLAIQDQTPNTYAGPGELNYRRWRWQAGIELTAVNSSTTTGLFLRYRPEKHQDYTLYASPGADWFIGLRAGLSVGY